MGRIGMTRSKVLLTGYQGGKGDLSTTETLLDKVSIDCDKFLFTNDFDSIKEEVAELILKDYDYIIMFGQKPVIKNLSVEIECFFNNEYEYTNFPLRMILNPLKKYNIDYEVKESPGNSYCNFAYYQVLKQVESHKLKTKVIFIHVPHLKNFVEFDKVVNMINEGGMFDA